jgi:hypothetical protein
MDVTVLSEPSGSVVVLSVVELEREVEVVVEVCKLLDVVEVLVDRVSDGSEDVGEVDGTVLSEELVGGADELEVVVELVEACLFSRLKGR